MERPESDQEAEVRLTQVLEHAQKLSQEKDRESRELGEGWLEEKMSKIPGPAKEVIRQRDRQLQEWEVNEQARSRVLDWFVSDIEVNYLDVRFTTETGDRVLKEQFGKETMREWLDEMIGENELTPEGLRKVARLSFDANGLKAVNDLSGSHDRGTEYLREIAKVITDLDSEPAKLLREAGATEILPMSGGGDEYSILVRGDKPLDQEKLAEAVRLYEGLVTEIADKEGVEDFIDFDSQETMLRYNGITREMFDKMGDEEKQAQWDQYRQDIPEGYRMKPSLSGGYETLDKGLMSAINDERDSKRLTGQEKSYNQLLAKIAGGLWDASDAAAEENKAGFKAGLGESADPNERALGLVFKRNVSEREASRELQQTRVELAKAQDQAKRADSYDQLIERKQAELAELMGAKDSLGDEVFMRQFMEISQKYDKMMMEIKDSRPV